MTSIEQAYNALQAVADMAEAYADIAENVRGDLALRVFAAKIRDIADKSRCEVTNRQGPKPNP